MRMTKKFHLAWFGNTNPVEWRKPSGALGDWRRPQPYQEIARLCERAKFDLILLADNMAVPSTYGGSRDWYLKTGSGIDFDTIPVVTMMAAATETIGIASTLSTTFYPPFILARLLATLDHMTAGRIGWNVVTTSSRDAALNFGINPLEHDERYDRADEYMELCRALWDSWEPDALVMNKQTGWLADPAKVHEVNFDGKYFRSHGILPVSSSPQHYPAILMAGSSPRGQRFAGRHADMAIAHKVTVEDMRRYVQAVRRETEAQGRDPASVKVFFSIKPVMGDTEAEAKALWDRNLENANIEDGLAVISNYLGVDMSRFPVDEPLPDDLKINGIVGSLQRYRSMGPSATLRDWARREAIRETYPICGTPEQVADVLEFTVRETDCDGFHFRATTLDYPYLLEVATKLVPVLQQRDLVRREYTGQTLRHHLSEF
jgi:FMN-dependent oxidoreductase (nitrilotriacetate monooxygenase family)